jgi:hypothetical protein
VSTATIRSATELTFIGLYSSGSYVVPVSGPALLLGSKLTLSEVPQNAAVSVYSSNLADIQTQTRGTSKLAAGYNSSLQGVIPIVLTPAVGAFFDKVGWRMPFGTWFTSTHHPDTDLQYPSPGLYTWSSLP